MVANFFKEFLGIFFGGILGLFYSGPELNNYGGFFGALRQMFAVDLYIQTFKQYNDKLSAGQWVLAVLCCLLVVAVLVAFIWVAAYFGKRFFKKLFGDKVLNQDLLDEIDSLKRELIKTTREKDRILGLKVAYQGYDILEGEEGEDVKSEKKEGESRFYKLTEVDAKYEHPDYKPPEYDNTITPKELRQV